MQLSWRLGKSARQQASLGQVLQQGEGWATLALEAYKLLWAGS